MRLRGTMIKNIKLRSDIPSIKNPDKNQDDPAQYFFWEGLDDLMKKKKCGELCVAYIVKKFGEDLQEDWGIKDLLKDWRDTFDKKLEKYSKELDAIYKSVMGVVKDKNSKQGKMLPPKMLEEGQIKSLLNLYDITETSKYKDKLTADGPFLLSPGRIKNLLKTHILIARVRRDKDGNIVWVDESKEDHWVVLDEIIPYSVDRGRVTIYNPWVNGMQEYSYFEFKKSLAPGYTKDCGLWVKRIRISEPKGAEDQITFR
jgi:hypothetical protein